MSKISKLFGNQLALCFNLLLALVCYTLCRVVYHIENISLFPAATFRHWAELYAGGIRFDLATLVYLNGLIIVLTLLPLHFKEASRLYYRVVKWLYVGLNGLFVVVNLMDAVYFQYTNRRTTANVLQEFDNEGNLGGIVGVEVLRHWYLVLIAVALIAGLWKCYRNPRREESTVRKGRYYLAQTLSLALMAGLCVGAARGGFAHSTRPITLSNANEYAESPIETAIVLNTPFSIIRTLGKKTFETPRYFTDPAVLEAVYNPVYRPAADARTGDRPASAGRLQPSADTVRTTPQNVVVFILESFGQEYIDGGYAPFIDSLRHEGVTFDTTIANGRKSIDGMPSVLSSIPMFVEPFFLTPASLNEVGGLADALNAKGYTTAFYHGAPNGSMGFEAFARATGFARYYGMTEYVADPATQGKADFDGMWAIWDEEFFQFFGRSLGELQEPFATALFSASSHHPFRVPERYTAVYPEESLPIHKCVRYTDHALRRFFDYARRQPWYANTLFVLTADHTSMSRGGRYGTDMGRYRVPLIFFSPNERLQAAFSRPDAAQPHTTIAQQIDILPTTLSYLGYDKPYIAFGKDLLHTPDSAAYAVNYNNGIYQYFDTEYMMQWDGRQVHALYQYRTDTLLQHNLRGTRPERENRMEQRLKAIVQQYMERMNNDRIKYK